MQVFVNGDFVPETAAQISIFDRGFLYGDGVFETIRVCRGRMFQWDRHWARLQSGLEVLGIAAPYSGEQFERLSGELLNRTVQTDCLLRINVSRGQGPRGYSPRNANQPTVVISVHAAPSAGSAPMQSRLATSSFRVAPDNPLQRCKTSNKLVHVLARAEAERLRADEGLMLGRSGLAAQATSANLFWLEAGTVCTPPLSLGILPGITRATVLELCAELTIPTREVQARPEELLICEGVFLTLTSWGIVEVVELDGHPLRTSPVVQRLWAKYESLLWRGNAPHCSTIAEEEL